MTQTKGIARTQQYGVTLLEVILVIALLSLFMIAEIEKAQREARQAAARNMGQTLFLYNNAVRQYVSRFQGEVTETNVPDELDGMQTGVDWLRSDQCADPGDAERHYLDCNFLQNTGGRVPFGNLQFETYFDVDWDPVSEQAQVAAITVMVNPDRDDPVTGTPPAGLVLNNQRAPALSSLAAMVVGGVAELLDSPVTVATDTDALYCVTESSRDGMCNADVLPAADYAVDKIVMRAGNFGGSGNDIFLRTDGSNVMQSNITFREDLPWGNRELRNVSRLLGSDSQGMQIGAAGGYAGGPPSEGLLVMDVETELYQHLMVEESDVTVRDGRLVLIEGSRPGSGEIEAHRFVDGDDPNYVLDPANTSQLNAVQAWRIENNPLQGDDITVFSEGDTDMIADGNISLSSFESIDIEASDRVDLRGDTIETEARDVHLKADETMRVGLENNEAFIDFNESLGRIAIDADNSLNDIPLGEQLQFLEGSGDRVAMNELLPNWVHKATWRSDLVERGLNTNHIIERPDCPPSHQPMVLGRVQALAADATYAFVSSWNNPPKPIHYDLYYVPALHPGFFNFSIVWHPYLDQAWEVSGADNKATVLSETYCVRDLSND